MHDRADWSETSWDGNRLRQHKEFLALPFREKLRRLEQMAEVAAFLAARRQARMTAGGEGAART